MPDREAIWNAIQESYTAQYLQIIKVKTLRLFSSCRKAGRKRSV
ncbi:hypothetical protein [Cohnella faecalis]|nr:hypothetical protein [Cohnella faecalis]